MTLRILHLSDTHLLGDVAGRHNGVDTTRALDRVLARAADVEGIGLVVVSGDLSEDGSPASYERLRERVDPFAAQRGAPVAYVMGNHDAAQGFEQVLGAREGAFEVGGFRVLRLDTSVPRAGYGELFPAQLDALRAQLATPAERGTIVVMHHAPIPAWTALLRALELQNTDAALDAISSGDVRLVLAGHYHHAVSGRAGRVPVIVAPGVTNTIDAVAPSGHERAAAGSGFAVIDLPETGEPAVTFVSVPEHETRWVFDMDETLVAQIAAQYGPGAEHRPQMGDTGVL
jgi:3',5'-cyclic AMP phosphodiesterase CpdA